jgi:hypothetical protein
VYIALETSGRGLEQRVGATNVKWNSVAIEANDDGVVNRATAQHCACRNLARYAPTRIFGGLRGRARHDPKTRPSLADKQTLGGPS